MASDKHRQIPNAGIRSALPSDAGAMAALVQSLTDSLAINNSQGQAEKFLQSLDTPAFAGRIESDEFDYLVAHQGETLAGFAAMRNQDHLYHLFVAREFQGQGIGRALWTRLSLPAHTNGTIRRITVNSNPSSVAVYRNFGFAETGPCIEEHGVAFVPMELHLHKQVAF